MKKTFEIKNTEQLLTLMELYLSEWQHRDNMFFKETFTYFFSSLLVMILPFAGEWGLRLPDALPLWLFPSLGILIAVAFIIVSYGYIVRLQALDEPYQKLIDKLPQGYRRNKVKKLYSGVLGTILNWRMAKFICIFMFLILIVVGVVLLPFTLSG